MANINVAAAANAADVLKSTASNTAASRTEVNNSRDFKDTLKEVSKTSTASDNNASASRAESKTPENNVSPRGDSKSQEVDEKLEKQLKEAGFSQEDIDKIEEEVQKGDIDGSTLSYLLGILLSYSGNLNDIESSQLMDKISDRISSDILKNLQTLISENAAGDKNMSVENIIDKIVEKNTNGLAEILQKLGVSQEFSEKLATKLQDGILSKISQGAALEQSLYNKIKSEINSALAAQINSDAAGEKLNNPLTGLKMQNIAQNEQSALVLSQNKGTSQDNSGTSGHKDSGNFTGSEEKILKNIMDSGSGDKISRAANFMSQFSNISGDSTVENLKNMVINKNSFTSDIIKTLKYMDLNNMKQLTVKINPRELGEITINLVMEAGKMKAAITASNQDTYNLLNYNLQDLSNKIQGNDIKVQSFSLNLYNEDTTYFRDESRKGRQNRENGSGKNMIVDSVAGEEASQENYYDENNVNILA